MTSLACYRIFSCSFFCFACFIFTRSQYVTRKYSLHDGSGCLILLKCSDALMLTLVEKVISHLTFSFSRKVEHHLLRQYINHISICQISYLSSIGLCQAFAHTLFLCYCVKFLLHFPHRVISRLKRSEEKKRERVRERER